MIEDNSKLSANASVADFSGLGLAGWLVQLFTAPVTFLIDSVSFVLLAISPWLGNVPNKVRFLMCSRACADKSLFDCVFHNPSSSAARNCSVHTLKEMFGGTYGALVMLYMVRGLGFAPGILGTIWTLGGLSSLVGAVSAGPMTRRIGMGLAMILAFLLYSIALLFIPLAQWAAVGAALLLIAQQI